jgi:hypothetical protein
MKNLFKKLFTRYNINLMIDFLMFLFLIFIGFLALLYLLKIQ